jgi:hypothetical protein
MLDWKFEQKRRTQKSRDPIQDSFFTNESIEDDTHALVRESIQNSLDAKADPLKPVRMSFTIGQLDSNSPILEKYITDEAWKHFTADNNGLISPPTKSDKCKYLVVEDFNTTGLVGDETIAEPQLGNAFYYFMRAEGQSGKEGGDRGRHGIGKYVFSKASLIRMFIAVTIRNSDNKCLIAGQSLLKSHTVDSISYTPDGWLGIFDGDDDFQLPLESNTLLKELNSEFKISRTEAKPGLSVLIPFIDSSLSINSILNHVVNEYFWPLLKGQLIVELTDDDQVFLLDAKTLTEKLTELTSDKKQMMRSVGLAIKAIESNFNYEVKLNLPDNPSGPKWNNQYLTKEISIKINEALFNVGEITKIRCPLYVWLDGSSDWSTSHFDIYITKDLHEELNKPLFIREGISIPEDKVQNIRGYTCIVVIDEGPLASLLGDSENPAHTEWEKNSARFKGKYKWGPSTIDFVRNSVTRLLKLLSQSDEELDNDVLGDIFHIDLPEDHTNVPEKRKKKKKEINPAVDIEPIIKKKNYFNLSRLDDGFEMKGPEQALESQREYKIKLAYLIEDASKAISLNKHHKNDFDLTKSDIQPNLTIENVLSHEIINKQTISFIADSNLFKVRCTGFDKKRDLVVDVKSAEVETL